MTNTNCKTSHIIDAQKTHLKLNEFNVKKIASSIIYYSEIFSLYFYPDKSLLILLGTEKDHIITTKALNA